MNKISAAILGLLLCVGLVASSWLVSNSALQIKQYERTVTVKGLSERVVAADTAIWPLQFSIAGNDVSDVYSEMEQKAQVVVKFLKQAGFNSDEISVSPAQVNDRMADRWGEQKVKFRYAGEQTITVYTDQVDLLRATQLKITQLGKQGIVIGTNGYSSGTQYLFSGLNKIKPEMVKEATQKARAVAEQFANDSNSAIGKMKYASQGQFSIRDRDSNTPYLKKVRVVSTVKYYLAD